MRIRLDDEDRRAVDLLLERATGIGDMPPLDQLFRAPVASGFEHRLDAAEQLLGLLHQIPGEHPPTDLAARTLQRIRETELAEKADIMPVKHTFQTQRPHA